MQTKHIAETMKRERLNVLYTWTAMHDNNTFVLFSYDYGDETICLIIKLSLCCFLYKFTSYIFLNLHYKKYDKMFLLRLELKILLNVNYNQLFRTKLFEYRQ